MVEHTAAQPLRLRLHQLLDAQGQLPRRRAVYFGTSTASITRELSLAEVSHLFHEGCVCVRSFNYFTGEHSSLSTLQWGSKLNGASPAA